MTESFFVSLGQLLIKRPKLFLTVLIVLFCVLLTQLAHIRIDTSAEGFLHEDAPMILDYDKFREEFGRDEFFVVAVTSSNVFDLTFLQALRDFHEAIYNEVPYLQSVESLVNTRSIYGDGDDLIAEELLEEFPQNAADVARIKARVQAKPVYYDRLINRAENTVTIMVKQVPGTMVEQADGSMAFESLIDTQILAGYNELVRLSDEFAERFPDGEVMIGGTPAVGSYMSTVLQRDFGVLTGVAILMVMIILWLLFRRLSGVFIPLTVMIIGIASCISMMPLLGYPMQVTTSILPSFLLAVCVGDAVHLLTIFYRKYDQGSSKDDALLYALNHTGMAVFFTSLTTAAGLLTFSVSEIQPVASLGLFAAIGSILAFLTTVVLLPLLIHLVPIKALADRDHSEEMQEGGLIYKFTDLCFKLVISHPKKIVFSSLVLMIIGFSIAPNIRFAQDSLTWFPDDTPVKRAIKFIEANVTGSMPIELVIDTGEEQGALNVEFLQTLNQWLEQVGESKYNNIPVVSVNGLHILIKETHQAFNGNKLENYIIPDERELIAQELLMIEMDQAKDLYEYLNKDKSKTRVTLIVPWDDGIKFTLFQKELRDSYNAVFDEQKYPLQMTGVIPIFTTMFTAMITSAAKSYLIAAVVISIMMILLLRSIPDGLLSMIPNLLPIVLVLAYMTIVDLPLDIFTVLIGSIALGLCVDDTVHFMHGFKTAFSKSGDATLAIKETLFSTGKALMITTVVLFFGFMTFMLSDLKNMDNFGMLMAICIILALLADFLVAPALMLLRYGNKR